MTITQKLTLNLADILERKYPSGFHVPADIDLGTFLEFADDDWDHCLDLDAHLEAEDSVALVWSVSDVLARRPDLTTEQAWTALVTARDDFRRGECHLDYIEATANGVFPVGLLAKELLSHRVRSLLTAVETLPDSGLTDPGGFGTLARQLEDLEKALAATGGQP